MCCSPWSYKELDRTRQLNDNTISLKLAGLFFLQILLYLNLLLLFKKKFFLFKYNTVTEWIFFKICPSNIFGPKYCFRIVSLPLWKSSLSLLTLKPDEPFDCSDEQNAGEVSPLIKDEVIKSDMAST